MRHSADDPKPRLSGAADTYRLSTNCDSLGAPARPRNAVGDLATHRDHPANLFRHSYRRVFLRDRT
jgi:hypothetical protein